VSNSADPLNALASCKNVDQKNVGLTIISGFYLHSDVLIYIPIYLYAHNFADVVNLNVVSKTTVTIKIIIS